MPSMKAKMEKKRLNGLRNAIEPPDSQAMPTHNMAKPAQANPVERRAIIWANVIAHQPPDGSRALTRCLGF